jgi:hypothetical protein
MLPSTAGSAFPRAVIGHRTFDAKVSSIKVGDDEEKRLGRIRVEFGVHAVISQSRLQRQALKYHDSSCHTRPQSSQSGMQYPAFCQRRPQFGAG